MKSAITLLLLCLVAGSGANLLDRFAARFTHQGEAAIGDDKPWFCHDLDCPIFELKETVGDYYEIREYPETRWVSTVESGIKFELALAKGFATLYRYIDGKNEDEKKINMGAPVVTRIKPVNGFRGSEQNYTIAFYLPEEFQKTDPPKPTIEGVEIIQIPGSTVYVAQFGGFATEGSVLSTAAATLEKLKKHKVDVEESFFYFGQYDTPTRIKNRHNEVWFAPKQEEAGAVAVDVA
jgi:hypothetical protein